MKRAEFFVGIAVALGTLGVVATTAQSANVVEEWASIKPEAAPELKPVTVDSKTTAVLVLDIVKGSCNNERRPRCVTSLPAVAKFVNEARAKGLLIINTVAGSATAADILPEVAPKPGEVILTGTNAEKFVRTDLDKILRDKGITTVIVLGTAAHGAVLQTGSQAAVRGFKVIVPVDGASSENAFAEQIVAWLFARAPSVSPNATVTKFDLIKF